MVFKLVRTDAEEPCKIQLPLGVHLIGRGKFLDCDDNRVSRKHGQIEVTEDTFSIKALHHNPCFYIKKNATETRILKQDCSVTLTNGDKFGLLPDTCWYELLHCSLDITSEDCNTQIIDELQTQDDETTMAPEPEQEPADQDTSADEEINFQLNESNTQRSESPSLIQGTEAVGAPGSPSFTQQDAVPSNDDEETSAAIVTSTTNPVVDHQPSEENGSKESPPKRCHSPESSNGVKKVKVEPEDVKPQLPIKDEPGSSNATPGPSGDNGTNSNDGNANAANPASPAKPVAPLRERCMYGANCYRKNPAHKAMFAHPADPDWGAGPRAACPRGRDCRRRDPRHWRDHHHPPGHAPPPDHGPPGYRVVQRHGNVFFINAHSVHFYDDHVQVEDSDGDSVDFDYEF